MTPPPADVEALIAQVEGVRRLARVLVRPGHEDEADDLVQDAVAVALEKPPKEGYGMRSWLSGIARRLARGRRRADARRVARESAAARPEAAHAEGLDVLEHLARRRLVIEAVAALPEDHARVIGLRFFDDLPPREIAARLGVPVETARTRLRRALARLRDDLDRRHSGDRRLWSALLAPLAGPDPASPVAPAAQGLAMTASTKAALTAAALLALGGGGLALSTLLGGEDESATRAAPRTVARSDRSPAASSTLAPQPGERAVPPSASAPRTADAAAAAANTPDRSRDDDPDGASIAGRVVGGPDGKPVAGAIVRLRPDSVLAHYLRLDVASRWSILEATTDAEGRYRFEGIRPGDGYALLVSAPGLALFHSMGLLLRSREAASLGDVVVGAGVAASGRVVGDDGKPVASARVAVAPMIVNPLQFVLARADAQSFIEARAETDADGRWRLSSIEPGSKTLFVEKAGLASAVVSDVLVGARADTTVRDVVLHVAGTIEGTALFGDGSAAVGARVLVALDEGRAGYAADVSADGRWRIDDVPPGRGPLYGFLRGLSPVFGPSVGAGESRVELRFSRPGKITGRVLAEDGTPVPRFSVLVRPEDAKGTDGAAQEDRDVMLQLVETTIGEVLGPLPVESPSGEFTIEPVEPRRCRVEVTARGLAPSTSEPVVVPVGGAPAPVVVRMTRDAGLRGVVTDADGKPVAGASVLAVVRGTTWAKPTDPSKSGLVIEIGPQEPDPVEAKSGADGAFSFPPLPPGVVGLTVRAAGFATWFRAGVDPHGGATPLRVVLGRGGTVVGRLSFASHPTAVGKPVRLASAVGWLDAVTVEGGGFRAEHVPPGRWLLLPLVGDLVFPAVTDEAREELERLLGAASVEVREGEETRHDLAVGALPSIEGRVEGIEPSGSMTVEQVVAQPMERAGQAVGDEETFVGPFIVSAHASANGRFVLEDLLPGRYRVLAFLSERVSPTEERRLQASVVVDVAPDAHSVSVTLRKAE